MAGSRRVDELKLTEMRIGRIVVKRKPRIANRNGKSSRVTRYPRRLPINVETSKLAEGRRKKEQVFAARGRILRRRKLPGRTGDRVGSPPSKLTMLAARTAGQPTRTAGQPARTAGQPARTAGQPARTAGQPARTASQPARTAGQPARTA